MPSGLSATCGVSMHATRIDTQSHDDGGGGGGDDDDCIAAATSHVNATSK